MKAILTLCLIFLASLLHAEALPDPQGDVILSVSGDIAVTNGEGVARFDRAMLEALAQRTTTTMTPWYETSRAFSGPLGQALLEAVGAQGQTVRIFALNDYSADVPVEDFQSHPVILATHADGQPLSIRDKGPLFLIYPFDEAPELFNEVYFGRSVWQIARIEVLD
ncbi:oxidoreductase [Roseobacter cerasinus]|uniref:Oxidoreductase n=1 Tax=Roseobacter cerasinus TaxID=2602289 RepID=A0A640VVL5_9RHOB|nr:molybdopterin-dependent oxidoreductase [Roseobacter cerasinus]GFE51450.1 oxidoreductase [Roseobacter cerasinus]